MKKYNKPEIVTLALESVDVIETSSTVDVYTALAANGVDLSTYTKQSVGQQINEMDTNWSW